MSPKPKTAYQCESCGHRAPKWLGQCPECGEWNTLVEVVTSGGDRRLGVTAATSEQFALPEPITEVESDNERRFASGISELDRVLGGGFVSGSSVLVGGEPGIGKSTLLLQALGAIAASKTDREMLLVSAEESKPQIRQRAERVTTLSSGLVLYCSTDADSIAAQIVSRRPDLVVIDSIQTIFTSQLGGAPGTVGQVRECAALITRAAREAGGCAVLVGHVTKEGTLAGPRTLEHMVDVVLSFEGDRRHGLRALRAEKNRFGPTGEVGLFEMGPDGLVGVDDPSARLTAGRPETRAGSVVAAVVEGHRPLLVELQALVSRESGGPARRVSIGADPQRVALIVAVLDQRAGIDLSGRDLYVAVSGGVRVDDPGADLPLALAIASAALDLPIDISVAAWGELGLAGEVRATPYARQRHGEALRLGFDRCLAPPFESGEAERDEGRSVAPNAAGRIPVSSISEALAAAGVVF